MFLTLNKSGVTECGVANVIWLNVIFSEWLTSITNEVVVSVIDIVKSWNVMFETESRIKTYFASLSAFEVGVYVIIVCSALSSPLNTI